MIKDEKYNKIDKWDSERFLISYSNFMAKRIFFTFVELLFT